MELDLEKKTYKVLLLDDERLIRIALKAFLKGTEFCLTAVSTAEEAEAALRHTNFDIIVSDVLMEPVDGFAFRDRVRRVDSGIPFIFLTSAASDHDNSLFLRIMDDLFSYYLPKDAGANLLLQKLRQVAQVFKARQEARLQKAIINRDYSIAATVQQALMPPPGRTGERDANIHFCINRWIKSAAICLNISRSQNIPHCLYSATFPVTEHIPHWR